MRFPPVAWSFSRGRAKIPGMSKRLPGLLFCIPLILCARYTLPAGPGSVLPTLTAEAESGLEILVGEPRVISASEGYHWFPATMLELKDKSILLGFSVSPDTVAENLVEGSTHALLRSIDRGENWFLQKSLAGHGAVVPSLVLDDGLLLGLHYILRRKAGGQLFTYSWVSRNNGRTFEGPTETPMEFPQVPQERPGQRSVPYALLYVDGKCFQEKTGDLLCTVDGKFQGDKKYRSMLIRSRDRGASWSYVSTVAQDPSIDFNEPAITSLPNGDLLCMIRTGSGKPMYYCRSTDGQTWSTPVSAGVNGVRPMLVAMSNGVVACSYGRVNVSSRDRLTNPSLGDQIIFSLDSGETWTEPTIIYDGPSTGYTSILEVRPGELLYVYDALRYGWHSTKNRIMRVNIKVRRR